MLAPKSGPILPRGRYGRAGALVRQAVRRRIGGLAAGGAQVRRGRGRAGHGRAGHGGQRDAGAGVQPEPLVQSRAGTRTVMVKARIVKPMAVVRGRM
ncbi:hypothetical protein GCM10023334_102900 [Nonomuraea thailandensis]